VQNIAGGFHAKKLNDIVDANKDFLAWKSSCGEFFLQMKSAFLALPMSFFLNFNVTSY
jgi:hypothetical protein